MAVNSYRFLGMYILIFLLMGTIGTIIHSTERIEHAYNMSSQEGIMMTSQRTVQLIETGDDNVKANELQLANNWGNERGLGGNIASIYARAFLPTGFIPYGYEMNFTQTERTLNSIIIYFRFIILIFAGLELFQILIKSKAT